MARLQLLSQQRLSLLLLTRSDFLDADIPSTGAGPTSSQFLYLLQQEGVQLVQVIQQRCSAAAVFCHLQNTLWPGGFL